jgi:BRCA1 C Terminus (BRCT) domain
MPPACGLLMLPRLARVLSKSPLILAQRCRIHVCVPVCLCTHASVHLCAHTCSVSPIPLTHPHFLLSWRPCPCHLLLTHTRVCACALYVLRCGQPAPSGHPDAFTGLTFVFSGVLSSMYRDTARDLVLAHGGRVTTDVSGRTSFLVVGDGASRRKFDKVRRGGAREERSGECGFASGGGGGGLGDPGWPSVPPCSLLCGTMHVHCNSRQAVILCVFVWVCVHTLHLSAHLPASAMFSHPLSLSPTLLHFARCSGTKTRAAASLMRMACWRL